jgi:hypothetical protein
VYIAHLGGVVRVWRNDCYSGDNFGSYTVSFYEAAAANPTITTQSSPSVAVGGSITDSATLAGGVSPTGTITFNLFGPDNANCMGSPIFTSAKIVAGNGSFTSDPFTALSPGIYRWVAGYSGDANNNAVGPTTCGDPAETVTVTKVTPTITAQASPSVAVSGSISDSATLAGGAGPTGTITFNLFGPENASCVGSPIFTSTKTVAGNGSSTSDPFTALSPGIYRWVAGYSGDANNNAAGPTICGDPAQDVIVTGYTAGIPTLDPRSLAILALLLAAAGFVGVKRMKRG